MCIPACCSFFDMLVLCGRKRGPQQEFSRCQGSIDRSQSRLRPGTRTKYVFCPPTEHIRFKKQLRRNTCFLLPPQVYLLFINHGYDFLLSYANRRSARKYFHSIFSHSWDPNMRSTVRFHEPVRTKNVEVSS